MVTFSDYLTRKIARTSSKEEHPSLLVSEAMTEARELGRSVAGVFQSPRRRKLEKMGLKLRES